MGNNSSSTSQKFTKEEERKFLSSKPSKEAFLTREEAVQEAEQCHLPIFLRLRVAPPPDTEAGEEDQAENEAEFEKQEAETLNKENLRVDEFVQVQGHRFSFCPSATVNTMKRENITLSEFTLTHPNQKSPVRLKMVRADNSETAIRHVDSNTVAFFTFGKPSSIEDTIALEDQSESTLSFSQNIDIEKWYVRSNWRLVPENLWRELPAPSACTFYYDRERDRLASLQEFYELVAETLGISKKNNSSYTFSLMSFLRFLFGLNEIQKSSANCLYTKVGLVVAGREEGEKEKGWFRSDKMMSREAEMPCDDFIELFEASPKMEAFDQMELFYT